jgi:hypothetical protein
MAQSELTAQELATADVAPGWWWMERKSLVDRFWAFVDKRPDGCWLWTGALFRDGYGAFRVPRGNVRAHRLSWALANRTPVPSGLVIRHTCDVKKCVNPAHLASGTPQDNSDDAVARKRLRTGPMPSRRWQPIETAPKDETDVLTYGPAGQVVARWEDDAWRVYNYGYCDATVRKRPTHWRPLPAPPSE